ncbi:hypothetical protein KPL70_006937 [Citrus sinensis]|nr:hypothetical protein KPL70_006937 [Citrus sinensis]
MTDMFRKQKPITVTKPKHKPKPEHHRQQLQPPPASLSKPNRGDRKDREVEETPKVNEKKVDSSFVGIEDKGIKKKRSQERSVSLRRNSRSSSRSGDMKHQFGGNELSSHDTLEAKTENQKENDVKKKKQGARATIARIVK